MKEMQETPRYVIYHDVRSQQFYTEVDGSRAYVNYTVSDNAFDIRRTFVPKEIGGRGIAAALVKEAYRYALSTQLKPVATCSYAATWLARHTEYGGTAGEVQVEKNTCTL